MPIALVRSYLAMLPRLAAEETLDASTAVALGSGALKAARQVSDKLLRTARAGAKPRGAKPSPAMLAQMGIGVVHSNG